MADFKTAWAITSSWEGPWKPYKNRDVKADPGDYLPFKKFGEKYYTGTSFGLTAQYMHEYVNWRDSLIRKELPGMPIEKASDIWERTRWKWMKGDDIKDQSVATLIFDFYVQQNNTAMDEIAAVLLKVYKKPTFNYTVRQVVFQELYRDAIAIDHPEPTGKLYGLTDLGVQLINNVETQEMLFNLIKKARISKLGNVARVQAFNYGNIITQLQYERAKEAKKKGLKVQKQAQLDADTEGSYGTYIAGAFALWIGYKWFKKRK
jgi:Glycosyl hydrolase 108